MALRLTRMTSACRKTPTGDFAFAMFGSDDRSISPGVALMATLGTIVATTFSDLATSCHAEDAVDVLVALHLCLVLAARDSTGDFDPAEDGGRILELPALGRRDDVTARQC